MTLCLARKLSILTLLSLPLLSPAQQTPAGIDVLRFPEKAVTSGTEVHGTVTKAGIKDGYYLTATLTGQGQQLIGIDLPLQIGEPQDEVDKLKQQFHWLPNIKAKPDEVISEHVFRSPCIIHVLLRHSIVLIPDLDLIPANHPAPYYLDLDYGDKGLTLHYGLAQYKTEGHIYYTRSQQPFTLPNQLKIGFYVLWLNATDPKEVLQKADTFLWQHFAAKYVQDLRPQVMSFQQYADTGYTMAFKHYWVNAGESLGGITLSTLYNPQTQTYGGRIAPNDLWYQSWFNNMRTAYGVYSWGKKSNRSEWMEKANGMARLLLHAPQNQGWFATVYLKDNDWLPSGVRNARTEYYMPDNAWTAYWLLRYHNEQANVPGAMPFLQSFAQALLKTQNSDGSFPSYIQAGDLSADTTLDHSAGSAMGCWFLEEMLLRKALTGDAYVQAVKKCNDFLIKNVLPNQRFEDFESFFSCSGKPMHYYDPSTAMYNQNTLSMQWCAEALLKGSQLFKDKNLLSNAEYCLNILSLYQQVWNPPFISFYAFGGFGAQNTDGEWSDARQAQFADTYLQFYQATHKKEYLERGIAACRASFALMVLPENKDIAQKNYRGTPFNGEAFTGTMAENYGHHGYDERSYQSGFHWGTGSALTTAAIFQQALGDKLDKPFKKNP